MIFILIIKEIDLINKQGGSMMIFIVEIFMISEYDVKVQG